MCVCVCVSYQLWTVYLWCLFTELQQLWCCFSSDYLGRFFKSFFQTELVLRNRISSASERKIKLPRSNIPTNLHTSRSMRNKKKTHMHINISHGCNNRVDKMLLLCFAANLSQWPLVVLQHKHFPCRAAL